MSYYAYELQYNIRPRYAHQINDGSVLFEIMVKRSGHNYQRILYPVKSKELNQIDVDHPIVDIQYII